MQTIDQTRLSRLEILIRQHGGKLANLNEALGYERTHTQLARIRNQNKRTDRPGKTFAMGDEQARYIEGTLGLAVGWMDTPPTYAELHGLDDPRTKAHQLMDSLGEDKIELALRLLSAFAQPNDHPKAANG